MFSQFLQITLLQQHFSTCAPKVEQQTSEKALLHEQPNYLWNPVKKEIPILDSGVKLISNITLLPCLYCMS